MITNKIRFFLKVLLFSFSCSFITAGSFKKIIDYSKKNYGTIVLGGVFAIFLAHSVYRKETKSDNWNYATEKAFPLNFLSKILNTELIFGCCFGVPALGIGALAVNHFSHGKIDFLSNNSKTIAELTKISASGVIPILTAIILYQLDL